MTDFLRDTATSAQQVRHWYAIYTRPRFERKVQAELTQLHIQSYVPTRGVWRVWSDRKKLIAEPLFPSYVFVQADPRERVLSLQARGVVRMVSFNGEPAKIPDEHIDTVRKIVQSQYEIEQIPYLRTGEKVEITAGALQGVQGMVVERRRQPYFIISIDVLHKSIAVQIDARYLKVIQQEVS